MNDPLCLRSGKTLQPTNPTTKSKNSKSIRTATNDRFSTTKSTVANQNRLSQVRTSLGNKSYSTLNTGTALKNRLSTTNSHLSTTPQNNKQIIDLSSIEDRLKSIEGNIIQKTRLSAIETEFNQLKESNLQLQLTIEQLKLDFESVQFVLAQLCDTETRVSELEAQCTRLTTENEDLKKTVAELSCGIDRIKLAPLSDIGVSQEQQELNANIVIRGIEVEENAKESDLLAIYHKISNHLGIADSPDHEPIAAKILSSSNNKSKSNPPATKPIQIKLHSITAKRQFLQARRIKRDILPSDIGIVQNSKKALLITEELTRKNQELLYQARSLRGRDKFKFVWSNNGQILARADHKSKVLRITDINHVNSIKAEFQQSENGRHNATESSRTD